MKRPRVQMSFAAAFHAKISAPPERVAASAPSDPASGGNSAASSACCVPASSSSKMSITRGGSGCPSCGAASGESAMPACRFECAPLTLEPHMNEHASSWLPTPCASSGGYNRGGAAGARGPIRPSLRMMAREGRLLPTPKASDGKRAGRTGGEEFGRHRTMAGMAKLGTIPTPTVKGNYNRAGSSPAAGDGLATAMGGTLNPRFVEAIMGFPIGWCDMPAPAKKGHSATPSYRRQRKKRG